MNEEAKPNPNEYPGYGRYPEMDYTGLDHHRASWVNHIVANLENDENMDTWNGILRKGTIAFMPGWSARNTNDFENVKRRLPDLQIVGTNKKTFWVKDADAYARLMQILLIEREEALAYANNIEIALGLRKMEVNSSESEQPGN